MLFRLPISAKIKAVIGLVSALVIVATGVAADNVLDLNDVTKYGAQLVEAIGAYVAIFKAPRNRVPGQVTFRTIALQAILSDPVAREALRHQLRTGQWPDDYAEAKAGRR